jgi:hypothetical protein
MTSFINLDNYPNLIRFVLFCSNDINGSGTTTISTPTTSPYAYYGAVGAINVSISGGTNQSGQAIMTTALAELNQLKLDLLALKASATLTTSPDATALSLPAGVVYNCNDGNSDIDFVVADGGSVTLTGPSAQTIIMAPSVRLQPGSTLVQGLQISSNIIWFGYGTNGPALSFDRVTNMAGICVTNSVIEGIGSFGNTNVADVGFWSGGFMGLNGTITINPITILCFLRGTPILTKRGNGIGYVNIENLQVGDMVVSYGSIHENEDVSLYRQPLFTTIEWIQSFKPQSKNESTYPILFKKGCLGINTPEKDVWMSPGHRVIVNGKLATAKSLVNGTTILQDKLKMENEEIEYFHFETESHSIVDVVGLKTETFLNLGYAFRNQPSRLIQAKNQNTLKSITI